MITRRIGDIPEDSFTKVEADNWVVERIGDCSNTALVVLYSSDSSRRVRLSKIQDGRIRVVNGLHAINTDLENANLARSLVTKTALLVSENCGAVKSDRRSVTI
jgi:hypothetical protein